MMNINSDTIVLAFTGAASVCGFIITSAVMLKNNRQAFKSLKDHFDSGISMLKMEINNNAAISNIELTGIKDDINYLDKSANGIKDQLKDEIYPRLNAVEKLSEKNCQVQNMHMKECDRRHRA